MVVPPVSIEFPQMTGAQAAVDVMKGAPEERFNKLQSP